MAKTSVSLTSLHAELSFVVPGTAVPGMAFYGSNQAVVQNQNLSVNSPTSPAPAGETVVDYFTGGGPVQAAGPAGYGHGFA